MSFGHSNCARWTIAALAFAGALIVGAASQAANTWDGGGGDDNWGTANNWDNNAVPSFPAPLTFTGNTRLTPSNNLGNVSVDGVTFDVLAGAFTIGGQVFTLGDAGTADYRRGGVTNLDNNLQTIGNNLTLTRGQHEITTSGGGLNLNGTITRAAGSATRFAPLGGAIKTTLTNTNGLIGGWATIQNPNPALVTETFLFAKVDGSGNVVPYLDYTAADDIDGFNGETAMPATTAASNIRWFGGADLTFSAGTTDINTFLFEENPATPRVADIGAGNTLRFTSGGGMFRSNPDGAQNKEDLRFINGNITAGSSAAPAELNIWTSTTLNTSPADPGEHHNFTIHLSTANIVDNLDGGKVTVVKNGPGAVRSSAAGHTFSGGLYLNRGVWRAQANIGVAFGAGDVHVASGAQAYVNTSGTVPNKFFLSGVGINEGTFEVGAIRIASNAAIMNGDFVLTGPTRFGNRGAQTTFGTTAGVQINGKVTGSFDLELSVKNDQGTAGLDSNMPTMILSNSANDWGGNTTIGRGRIRIGGTGEVIPNGPGKGNLTIMGENISESILTLDSKTETINGLFSSGDASLAVVTNSTAGEGILRVGDNNATSLFEGSIVDHPSAGGIVSLTKIGGGSLTLSSTLNNYSGNTRVEGGRLVVDNWLLNSAADVLIGQSAQLELVDSTTHLIDNLYFAGQPVAAGTYGRTGSPSVPPAFQRNYILGDGLLQVQNTGPTILLVGDYNKNGVVDAADYTVWRNAVTAGALTLDNRDPNNAGVVGHADLVSWRANFGRTPGSGSFEQNSAAHVPEPASLALLLIAALCGSWARPRKRSEE